MNCQTILWKNLLTPMTNPQAEEIAQRIAARKLVINNSFNEQQCKCPTCENIYPVYPHHHDEDGKCPKCEDKFGLAPLWTDKPNLGLTPRLPE